MMNREFKKLASDVQMSEAFITSMFLALSGGFQDAYTYFTRDEVFSNAQTGNVVLMSTHLMMGEWMQGISICSRFWLSLVVYFCGASSGKVQICQETSLAAGNSASGDADLVCGRFIRTEGRIWLRLFWFPSPVRCRYRPSARSMDTDMPAQCVSEI